MTCDAWTMQIVGGIRASGDPPATRNLDIEGLVTFDGFAEIGICL